MRTRRICATPSGSLGDTGKGHGNDKAVMPGLCGFERHEVEIDAVAGELAVIRSTRRLSLLGPLGPLGVRDIAFAEKSELQFYRCEPLPFHANGMRFSGVDSDSAELLMGCH